MGGAIWLERVVPGLEGKLVEVQVEIVEDRTPPPTQDAQREAWNAWVAQGPQGPISDDDDDGADWP